MEQAVVSRLEALVGRHAAMAEEMADPAVIQDQPRYRELGKSYNHLSQAVAAFNRYKQALAELSDAEELSGNQDPEMALLGKEEMARLTPEIEGLEKKLKLFLLPPDPNDDKNVILEIRAGTGGEEAGLFAADLFRMFTKYAERSGWRAEVLSSSETGLGGLKEVILSLAGDRVYSRLKYEGGVHRVQRVPETEAQGRIHTSAVTVAVLPEAEDVDVRIEEKDLRIDRFCSSGPGGQSVNTTYSAVRITHIPTGLVVSCQDEKSQIKNKAKALKVLRSRLLKMEEEKRDASLSNTRKAMVGSGDRSEKMRTYNFPQNRITDHRVNITLHRLTDILDGDMDLLLQPMHETFASQRLEKEFSAAGPSGG